MSKLLEQARKMQEKMNRDLSETLVHASAAEGRVNAKMNGHRHLLSIKIDPELMDPANIEEIEAVVLEVVNEVTEKMTKILLQRLGPAATNLPSLFG